MALRKISCRHLGALALVIGLAATFALPAVAGEPPTPASPAASDPTSGLVTVLADWLHQLIGDRPPAPPPGDGGVLDSSPGPAGPLIDPDGYAPKDPRPQDGHGRHH